MIEKSGRTIDPSKSRSRAIGGNDIVARLLTRQQAAAYCGICVSTFTMQCPVRPVALGSGKRLERYDIRCLDEWIDALGGRSAPYGKEWLQLLDGEHDNSSRGRS